MTAASEASEPLGSNCSRSTCVEMTEEGLMVGGLKIIVVKLGNEQEFESLFAELRAKIRNNEPDCVLYSLLKSRTNPPSYVVQEQYRDQSALEAHQSSEHGKVYFPKIRAILESITVEYFDTVVV
jgi:quinol monooxygenase YgiN